MDFPRFKYLSQKLFFLGFNGKIRLDLLFRKEGEMSFRCEKCGKPQPQGNKPFSVVTEIRRVVYIQEEVPGNPESFGWERVKVLRVCSQCRLKLENYRPSTVGTKRVAAKLPTKEKGKPRKRRKRREWKIG